MYKNILIVGEGNYILPLIKENYNKENCLTIGDGYTRFSDLDFTELKNIDESINIIIWGHGSSARIENSSEEYYFLDSMIIDDLFKEFSKLMDKPVYIDLYACHSGTAAYSVEFLPHNSILVCHGGKNKTTRIDSNREEILNRSKNLAEIKLETSFINYTLSNFSNDMVISKNLGIEGGVSIYELGLEKLYENLVELASIENVRKYLTNTCSDFISSYKDNAIEIPQFSDEYIINFSAQYFYYLLSNGDEKLFHAIDADPMKFTNIVNYKNSCGKPVILFFAVEDEEILKHILPAKPNLKIRDQDGSTLIAHGTAPALKLILEENSELINEKSDSGMTALDQALANCDIDKVRILLNYGADFNLTVFKEKFVPLDIKAMNELKESQTNEINKALINGNNHLAKYFIEKSPEFINKPDENGWTPLHFAAYYGREDIIKELIAARAEIDSATKFGCMALTFAIHINYSSIIDLLTKDKLELNSSSPSKQLMK